MKEITKIIAAENQLCTAIRLFYNDDDPISVHTLACAAREIIATLLEKKNLPCLLTDAVQGDPKKKKELRRTAAGRAKFFKHADKDPTAVLTDFSDKENDPILFIAAYDFGRLVNGMPIEMQVFESWYLAREPERVLETKRSEFEGIFKQLYPDIRNMTRSEQKKLGLKKLSEVINDPRFQMDYSKIFKPAL